MVKIISLPEEVSTTQLERQFPSHKRTLASFENMTPHKRLRTSEKTSANEDKRLEDNSTHPEQNDYSIWETDLPLVNELLSSFTNEENQPEKRQDNSIWEIVDFPADDELLSALRPQGEDQLEEALANIAQHYPSSAIEALLREMEVETQPQDPTQRKPFTEKIKTLSFNPNEYIPDAFQFVYMHEFNNGLRKPLEPEKYFSIFRYNPGYLKHARFFVAKDDFEYDELEYKVSSELAVDKYFFNLPHPDLSHDNLMRIKKARHKGIRWEICATNPNFTVTQELIGQQPLQVSKRKSATNQSKNTQKIKYVEVVKGFAFRDINNIPQALQFKYYVKTDMKKKGPCHLELQNYARIFKVTPSKGRTDRPRYFVGKKRIDHLLKGTASVDRFTGHRVAKNAPNSISAHEFRNSYPGITWRLIISGLEGMDYAITKLEYPMQLTVAPEAAPATASNSQTTAADILLGTSTSVLPLSLFSMPTLTTTTRQNTLSTSSTNRSETQENRSSSDFKRS